ncbi:hypothetical protein PUN4_350050 [Paraburkholderia unamae]|nr:hypothetical protein PUN4_350050 [Paraburkholderia unamae]
MRMARPHGPREPARAARSRRAPRALADRRGGRHRLHQHDSHCAVGSGAGAHERRGRARCSRGSARALRAVPARRRTHGAEQRGLRRRLARARRRMGRARHGGRGGTGVGAGLRMRGARADAGQQFQPGVPQTLTQAGVGQPRVRAFAQRPDVSLMLARLAPLAAPSMNEVENQHEQTANRRCGSGRDG